MECDRCHGFMVSDIFEDYMDDTGRNAFFGWRCLQCGAILDPLIAEHRLLRPQPVVAASRRRWTVHSRGG